jgi:hypothetical protein
MQRTSSFHGDHTRHPSTMLDRKIRLKIRIATGYDLWVS